MRLAVIALLATTACAQAGARGTGVDDVGAAGRRGKPDLEAARELDQQGVRAFRDGRFSDAIRYFLSAYRLGAPSNELWNVARSRERMDDAEWQRTCSRLRDAGLLISDAPETRTKLKALIDGYEPCLYGLAERFVMPLPPWVCDDELIDNWQSNPWGSGGMSHLQ